MKRVLELLFPIAAVIYTTIIWRHFFFPELTPKMKRWFLGALCLDSAGTIFLCGLFIIHWQWTLHSISGLLSLLIMILHYCLLSNKRLWSSGIVTVLRYTSIGTWILWMTAFISGLPLSQIFSSR